ALRSERHQRTPKSRRAVRRARLRAARGAVGAHHYDVAVAVRGHRRAGGCGGTRASGRDGGGWGDGALNFRLKAEATRLSFGRTMWLPPSGGSQSPAAFLSAESSRGVSSR